MSEKPPIPPAIWSRIIAFLKEQRTGQITLNVHRGHVNTAEIGERIRDGEEVKKSA